MSNIKGLYFKLNMNNPTDARIYNFFQTAPQHFKINKIQMLAGMIRLFEYTMAVREAEDEND